VPGKKGGGQVEPTAYSDQLIATLQQIRERATENAADPELKTMLLNALAIANQWCSARRPQRPEEAGLEELIRYTRDLADAYGLDEELVGAVHAIDPDYTVQAIDNAIHVVTTQAGPPPADLHD
jgi:hypothetical protein